jgi:hypothetical protein
LDLCLPPAQVCDVGAAIQWLNKGAAAVCVPAEVAESLAEAGVPAARVLVETTFTDVAAWEALVERVGPGVSGFNVELTVNSPAAAVSHLEKMNRIKRGMVSEPPSSVWNRSFRTEDGAAYRFLLGTPVRILRIAPSTHELTVL